MIRNPEKDCAHCGACLAVCPTFRATGREDMAPRGRLRIIGLGLAGRAAERGLATCLLCGACEEACGRGLDITARIAAARKGRGIAARIVSTAVESAPAALAPLARLAARATGALPPENGLWPQTPVRPRHRAAATVPPGGVAVFTGCYARYLDPGIIAATVALERFCHGTVPSVPERQACCGLASWSAGRTGQARALAKRNIEAFAGAGTILVPCASCFHQLASYPALFGDDRQWQARAAAFAARVEPFSRRFTAPAAMAALGGGLAPLPEETVCLWHDPCHLRFRHGLTAEPRRLLGLVPGLLLREFGRGPRCCGMGGAFGVAFPGLSAEIVAPALAELADLRVAAVVTSCSGCLLQWQRHSRQGRAFAVAHPAPLLAALLPERT